MDNLSFINYYSTLPRISHNKEDMESYNSNTIIMTQSIHRKFGGIFNL